MTRSPQRCTILAPPLRTTRLADGPHWSDATSPASDQFCASLAGCSACSVRCSRCCEPLYRNAPGPRVTEGSKPVMRPGLPGPHCPARIRECRTGSRLLGLPGPSRLRREDRNQGGARAAVRQARAPRTASGPRQCSPALPRPPPPVPAPCCVSGSIRKQSNWPARSHGQCGPDESPRPNRRVATCREADKGWDPSEKAESGCARAEAVLCCTRRLSPGRTSAGEARLPARVAPCGRALGRVRLPSVCRVARCQRGH